MTPKKWINTDMLSELKSLFFRLAEKSAKISLISVPFFI